MAARRGPHQSHRVHLRPGWYDGGLPRRMRPAIVVVREGHAPVHPKRDLLQAARRDRELHPSSRRRRVDRSARGASQPERAEPVGGDRIGVHGDGSRGKQLRQPTGRAEHRSGPVPAQPQFLAHRHGGVLTMTQLKHAHAFVRASFALAALLTCGCVDLTVPDLNNPAIEDLQRTPTRTRVLTATQGLFIGARTNIAAFNGYVATLGVLGRESYNFDPGDPRFITELLVGPLDGGSPRFGGNLWNERFANIRNANVVLNALDVLGTTPPVGMTDAEKQATRGLVKTLQALDYLLVIDTRDTLGAPVDLNRDVSAPLALFVSRDSVYAYIAGLLDAAVAHLAAGGGGFPPGLSLPAGFTGFTTPGTFVQFNRALKARLEAYRATRLACGNACWTRAKSALDSSFLSVSADTSLKDGVDSLATAAMLARGAYYGFGSESGDLANALTDPTGSKQRGHPSLRTQAETQVSGIRDRRFLTKVDSTVGAVTRLGHTSDMAFKIYGKKP